jgi:hypothetical protein
LIVSRGEIFVFFFHISIESHECFAEEKDRAEASSSSSFCLLIVFNYLFKCSMQAITVNGNVIFFPNELGELNVGALIYRHCGQNILC